MKSKNIDAVLEIWTRVGFIMHLCHLIEFNLAKIYNNRNFLKALQKTKHINMKKLADMQVIYEEKFGNLIKNNLMGDLINKNNQAHSFKSKMKEDLNKVKQLRDYMAHDYFKTRLYTKELETNPGILIPFLYELTSFLHSVHKRLLSNERSINRKISNLKREIYYSNIKTEA